MIQFQAHQRDFNLWKKEKGRSVASHNSIFLRQIKNYGIHYLTGQNRGLSGLKNNWPVIMTGDLLSVIFGSGVGEKNDQLL